METLPCAGLMAAIRDCRNIATFNPCVGARSPLYQRR